jgi:four helix bundle protein
MKDNVIKTKSYQFAIKIVSLYKFLVENKKEYILSKQLLRSGTSVGAMVREAEHAESKVDFNHKLSIAQKEINETLYWLELLKDSDYLSKEKFDNIFNDALEIIRIITKIITTIKLNMKKE